VVLGRLNPEYFLGGELPLDPGLAHGSVLTLALELGISVEDAAQAIVELAVENMANAIRLLCADRGIDYRSLVLMAFGGAGPLHAALIGRRLGLELLVIPPEPGLASALGALVADLRVDRRVTRSFRSDEPAGGELRAALEALADEAMRTLHEEGQAVAPAVIVSAACRYVGQNYEQDVSVPLEDAGDLLELVASRFHAQHEAIYGYRLEDAIVEIVHLGATAVDTGHASGLGSRPVQTDPGPAAKRPVFFKDQGWTDIEIMRRNAIPVGIALAGPLVIEEHDSTVLVLDGQQVRRHETGALILESLVSAEQRTPAIRGSAVVG
jgi:N-methylhydantoinase A